MTTYTGARMMDGTTQVLVLTETSVRDLDHHVRHSPTGFEWGYGGSGPADLARCLLIDALGDAALCPVCLGRGVVLYEPATVEPRPLRSDEELSEYRELAAANDERADGLVTCIDCDSGIRRLPYMDFKFEVIARLDRHSWSMTREEVLRWLTARDPDPTFHVLLDGVTARKEDE